MIFLKTPFNSFLALILGATLLTSCLEKKSEVIPPKLTDDKIITLIDKEIAGLEIDKVKMKERLDSSAGSIEENALRPKMLDYLRREYFKYDTFARQIDQRIDYYKIRRALREKDVNDRIKKNLTLKELEQEGLDYEISAKANIQKYIWRKLPAPPKKAADKDKKEGHGEEKSEGHGEKKDEKKEEPAKGGHH